MLGVMVVGWYTVVVVIEECSRDVEMLLVDMVRACVVFIVMATVLVMLVVNVVRGCVHGISGDGDWVRVMMGW